MVYTTQIINELISYINDDLNLTDQVTAIRGFDDVTFTRPIDKTYLSFTCKEETVTYFDSSDEYCQKVSIELLANCFVPLTTSVLSARNVAEIILSSVNDNFADQITGYSIGETDYDDDINAYKIACTLSVEYNLCPGQSTASTALSTSSTYFCQTHINDTDKHLSETTLDKINNPFTVGTYEGTGFSVYNTIDVGFRPSALFIFAADLPLTSISSSRINSLMGMATQDGTSQGIVLNSSGFSVRQNSSDSTDDQIALINDSGTSYCYIAFK